MADPINVTMTVNPPSPGSDRYTVSCDDSVPYVHSNCLIDANMALHIKRKITITLDKYNFYSKPICFGDPHPAPNSTCDITHSPWGASGGGTNKITINAKLHLWDLKYTLYVQNTNGSSVPITIDPMISNGIKHIADIFMAILVGSAVIGAFYYNRLRLRRTGGPIAPA